MMVQLSLSPLKPYFYVIKVMRICKINALRTPIIIQDLYWRRTLSTVAGSIWHAIVLDHISVYSFRESLSSTPASIAVWKTKFFYSPISRNNFSKEKLLT